ncbi:MAG: hypothetical protein ACXAC7_22240, partial [Candidatus Hodarchaeales archaeon]
MEPSLLNKFTDRFKQFSTLLEGSTSFQYQQKALNDFTLKYFPDKIAEDYDTIHKLAPEGLMKYTDKEIKKLNRLVNRFKTEIEDYELVNEILSFIQTISTFIDLLEKSDLTWSELKNQFLVIIDEKEIEFDFKLFSQWENARLRGKKNIDYSWTYIISLIRNNQLEHEVNNYQRQIQDSQIELNKIIADLNQWNWLKNDLNREYDTKRFQYEHFQQLEKIFISDNYPLSILYLIKEGSITRGELDEILIQFEPLLINLTQVIKENRFTAPQINQRLNAMKTQLQHFKEYPDWAFSWANLIKRMESLIPPTNEDRSFIHKLIDSLDSILISDLTKMKSDDIEHFKYIFNYFAEEDIPEKVIEEYQPVLNGFFEKMSQWMNTDFFTTENTEDKIRELVSAFPVIPDEILVFLTDFLYQKSLQSPLILEILERLSRTYSALFDLLSLIKDMKTKGDKVKSGSKTEEVEEEDIIIFPIRLVTKKDTGERKTMDLSKGQSLAMGKTKKILKEMATSSIFNLKVKIGSQKFPLLEILESLNVRPLSFIEKTETSINVIDDVLTSKNRSTIDDVQNPSSSQPVLHNIFTKYNMAHAYIIFEKDVKIQVKKGDGNKPIRIYHLGIPMLDLKLLIQTSLEESAVKSLHEIKKGKKIVEQEIWRLDSLFEQFWLYHTIKPYFIFPVEQEDISTFYFVFNDLINYLICVIEILLKSTFIHSLNKPLIHELNQKLKKKSVDIFLDSLRNYLQSEVLPTVLEKIATYILSLNQKDIEEPPDSNEGKQEELSSVIIKPDEFNLADHEVILDVKGLVERIEVILCDFFINFEEKT